MRNKATNDKFEQNRIFGSATLLRQPLPRQPLPRQPLSRQPLAGIYRLPGCGPPLGCPWAGPAEGEHPLAARMLSGCQQAVRVKKYFLPKHIFSINKPTKYERYHIFSEIRTLPHKFPKIKNRRVAVRRLSGCCRVAVGQKSSQF